MDRLMEKLESMAEHGHETARKARKLAHGSESRADGIERAMELIRQDLDHTDELRIAEEGAEADGSSPQFSSAVSAIKERWEVSKANYERMDAGTSHIEYTHGFVEGLESALTAALFAEDAAEDAEADAERRQSPEYRHGDLSFVQLAELAHDDVQELLRRSKARRYSNMRGRECRLADAVSILETAKRVGLGTFDNHPDADEEPNVTDGTYMGGPSPGVTDFPHLDDDGEPGVTDGQDSEADDSHLGAYPSGPY